MTKVKKIDSDEVVEELANKSTKVIVYGAGFYGHVFTAYLRKKYQIDLLNFAVSDSDKVYYDNKDSVKVIDEYDISSTVVIAVSEQHQKDLINKVLILGFSDVYIMLNDFLRYMTFQMDDNRLTRKERLSFEVHLTEHCNLNCKGCYHYSPLADEEYLGVDEFELDLKRIYDLCKDKIDRITLLGGEPLLHPNIIDFIKCARRIHRLCRIEILTNGILLPSMSKEFWKACKNNDIQLCATKYPINLDYELIEEIASSYDLTIEYHNDIGAGEKTLIKYPFDIAGSQNGEEMFRKCTRSNLCITLKHGKLYPCPMAAHAHLAKKFFDIKSLELSERDYIDIYETSHMEEVMDFFTHPIPFCRYCDLTKRPEQQNWEKSGRKYDEWF